MSRFLRWVPVFLYCALIFYISSLPLPSSISFFSWDDKLIHLMMYVPLGYLLMCAMREAKLFLGLPLIIWVTTFSALYGATMEIHQFFTPPRTPEVLDGVSDAVGGAVGALMFLLVRFYNNKVYHLSK